MNNSDILKDEIESFIVMKKLIDKPFPGFKITNKVNNNKSYINTLIMEFNKYNEILEIDIYSSKFEFIFIDEIVRTITNEHSNEFSNETKIVTTDIEEALFIIRKSMSSWITRVKLIEDYKEKMRNEV